MILKTKLWYWLLALVVIGLSGCHANKGGFFFNYHIEPTAIICSVLLPLGISKASTLVTKNKECRSLAITISVIIAFCITIGKNFFYSYNWTDCIDTKWSKLLILTQTTIYSIALYKIALGLVSWLYNHQIKKSEKTISLKKWFFICLIVRLFFLAAFYPCIFDFDAAVGLRTLLDENSATCDHHPYFVQLIHATFFLLGQSIGSVSAGMAVLSVFWITASCAIIVYCLNIHRQAGLGQLWLRGLALIYTFFPLFPYLSLLTTKDGFFAYAFLLYIYTLYAIYITQGKCLLCRKYRILHATAILAVCLTRNQGLYLVIPECIIAFFYYWKLWQYLLKAILLPLCLFTIFCKVIMPWQNVEPGGKQETFGMLFQQTAYYLRTHPNDVTASEKEAINAILNTDSLVAKYRIYITDPVKNDYKYNPRDMTTNSGPRVFRHIDRTGESQDLANYLAAWFSMGLRHPKTYFEAAASIFMGFFYNSDKALIDIYTSGAVNPKASTPEYQFWRIDCISEYIYQHRKDVATIPIANWLCAIPYYIWSAMVLLITLAFRRVKQGLLIFLPVLLSILLLFVCPVVNGRYAFPVVVALPLLFTFVVTTNKSNEAENSGRLAISATRG